MRSSPCHPHIDLKLRRMGKRGIYLTSCPVCDAKYQITEDGKIYQTATKRADSKTWRGSVRLTEKRLNEIRRSKWKTPQRFLDEGEL